MSVPLRNSPGVVFSVQVGKDCVVNQFVFGINLMACVRNLRVKYPQIGNLSAAQLFTLHSGQVVGTPKSTLSVTLLTRPISEYPAMVAEFEKRMLKDVNKK